MVAVTSWGRLSLSEHRTISLNNRLKAASVISSTKPAIAYGMGRSYGDVCLNPGGVLWMTSGIDRFISLDENTGYLVCEAGILLRDIQKMVVPRGWILPVTPGTQLITVGGAIANDVHGKNHHRYGSFGEHVSKITLLRTDGEVIECSPEIRNDWFAATVGGVGLTGLILVAGIQLRKLSSPWLDTETIPYVNLAEFFELADGSESAWEHTVSWIDCISGGGRGLFMRGNHVNLPEISKSSGSPRTFPAVPPVSLVNELTLRAFNVAYYNFSKKKAGRRTNHYESFFYPLDNILEWNRIYGPKGFFQYQCVVPGSDGRLAIQAMLKEISGSGSGSFLAILKTFGSKGSTGMMGFPGPGVTLALDFPNKGERTEKLFARLDAIVGEAGGRIYLAKDARMSRQMFETGYPRLSEFLTYRDKGISSAMSRRLMGF